MDKHSASNVENVWRPVSNFFGCWLLHGSLAWPICKYPPDFVLRCLGKGVNLLHSCAEKLGAWAALFGVRRCSRVPEAGPHPTHSLIYIFCYGVSLNFHSFLSSRKAPFTLSSRPVPPPERPDHLRVPRVKSVTQSFSLAVPAEKIFDLFLSPTGFC